MRLPVRFRRALKISGFGNFVVRDKNSRKGRNPQTGQEILLEARKVLTFKPSLVLKNFRQLMTLEQPHLNGEISEGMVAVSLFRVHARHVVGLHEPLRDRDLAKFRVLHVHEMQRLANVTRVNLAAIDQELSEELHPQDCDSTVFPWRSSRMFSMRDSI